MSIFVVSEQKWLPNLIERAIKENWCLKSFCTTCGAEQFRNALRKKTNELILEEDWHCNLISSLNDLHGPLPIIQKQHPEYEAVRLVFVLLDIEYGKDLDQKITGHWASEFLHQMRNHYEKNRYARQ